MKLYHKTDIAVKPMDTRDGVQSYLSLDVESNPISTKGTIVLSEIDGFNIGDVVYFDNRGVTYIEELELVIMDNKNVLIKENDL